jgi:diaminohydroxyphosphoribosylaminopyrimidine deaminase / 5-amino-6-(5-phosphoribosylamino)uracil reductase
VVVADPRDDELRDEEWMVLALAEGASVRGQTAPNPWVGCVVVRDGAVVGTGATRPHGRPHAETEALEVAGERARGGTAYVTLEPCSHHGGTPPCVDALVAAGVARVVVALADPDARVAGSGIAALRAAGIVVDVGVRAGAVARDLLPYLVHRREGRAAAVVKLALSLDGRTAAADGTSRWSTGPESRADVHRLRAESQAVVVGSGTALADHPSLTARGVELPNRAQPLRVLLDARGRVPARGPLFDVALAPTLVLTTSAAPDAAVAAWLAAGAKVQHLPAAANGSGVDLRAALDHLGTLDVLTALVEGGATLAAALTTAGLADRLIAYVAPSVLGTRGRPALDLPGPDTVTGAVRWRLAEVAALGDDVRLVYAMHGGPADEGTAG